MGILRTLREFENALSRYLILALVLCVARTTLSGGYAVGSLTMPSHIAKVKMIDVFGIYTPAWYFGYDIIRFNPPLPIFMNYILGKFLGYEFAFNILTFLFVYIYAITVFKVVYRMCESPSSAVLSTLFLLSSHAFVSSYLFHAETPRLIGSTFALLSFYNLYVFFEDIDFKYLKRFAIFFALCLLSGGALELSIYILPLLVLNYKKVIMLRKEVLSAFYLSLGMSLWWVIPAVIPYGFTSKSFTILPTLDVFPPLSLPVIQLPLFLIGIFSLTLSKNRLLCLMLALTIFSILCGNIHYTTIATIFAISFGVFSKKYRLVALLFLPILVAYVLHYSSITWVNYSYIDKDEYIVSKWLEDKVDGYRVYMMCGRDFKGCVWLNAIAPKVKQVLGGCDKATKDEPFKYDKVVKYGISSDTLYNLSVKYGVKYIVIDKSWFEHHKYAYQKFNDSRFKKVLELRTCEVYEVSNVKTAEDKGYFFLTPVRIFSLLLSLLFARIGFRRLRSLD